MNNTTILGAGLAGLSTSYHVGHERCILFEKKLKAGGHAGSECRYGFTYDQGPHVSFTKHEYVRDLFARNTGGDFHEFPVRTRNYYRGNWIEHPAQAHLWQVPQPLREKCVEEMLAAAVNHTDETPRDYQEWLVRSFGATFAESFPAAYTRKYWTVDPEKLSVDWLGPRMPRLNVMEIERGLEEGIIQHLHYITNIRYPNHGGYQSFFEPLADNACIRFGRQVSSIDLVGKRLWMSDGSSHCYDNLVSTLPLPDFVNRCQQVPTEVREAAAELDCSQLLLIDVFIPCPCRIEGHWFYVYDVDKWSTRIHCVERLSPSNAPEGWSGIQVEVYFSKHRPFPGNPSRIANEVVSELESMGFLDSEEMMRKGGTVQWRWSPYANVIFTHSRRVALDRIWTWLEEFGLKREHDDLEAMSDWEDTSNGEFGSLSMAGRFAQWKYFWTDDCVLRGRQLAQAQQML